MGNFSYSKGNFRCFRKVLQLSCTFRHDVRCSLTMGTSHLIIFLPRSRQKLSEKLENLCKCTLNRGSPINPRLWASSLHCFKCTMNTRLTWLKQGLSVNVFIAIKKYVHNITIFYHGFLREQIIKNFTIQQLSPCGITMSINSNTSSKYT